MLTRVFFLYHYKIDGQAFIHREKPPLRVKDPRRQKLQMLLGFKRKGAVWTATAELTELERELDIRLLEMTHTAFTAPLRLLRNCQNYEITMFNRRVM